MTRCEYSNKKAQKKRLYLNMPLGNIDHSFGSMGY